MLGVAAPTREVAADDELAAAGGGAACEEAPLATADAAGDAPGGAESSARESEGVTRRRSRLRRGGSMEDFHHGATAEREGPGRSSRRDRVRRTPAAGPASGLVHM